MRQLAMDTASRIFTLRTQVSQVNNKDAIVVNLVIKDFAGQAYELTGRSNPPRSSSAKRYSSDSYSTFRFVATLALAPDQWVQILKSTHQRLPNFHSSHTGEIHQAVAQAVMRGDLTLYRLPSLNASNGLAGKKGFGLSIIKGPNPHSATDLMPQAIQSADSAQQLLDELGISSQAFLGYLTNESLFNGEQKKNALSEALQLLASGELLAYKIPLPPKAPPVKAVEYVAAATADKPVPLAPESRARTESVKPSSHEKEESTGDRTSSDVVSNGDGTKASYDEFCDSVEDFEARGALSEQAYDLYIKENWSELEILFNEKNLNGGWPPNRGAISTTEITLPVDAQIDRYGGFTDKNTGQFRDLGTFVSYKGEPFENRALPLDTKNKTLKSYKVIKPIPKVNAGKAIPWFNQSGLGTQLETPLTIEDLMIKGYLKEV